MNARGARSDVIGNGQTAAPLSRNDGAGELLKNGLRICIRDGQNGNFDQALRFGDGQALAAFFRGPAGR